MLAKNVTTLVYAVRGRVILKYYGQLCLSLAGMTAVALAVALGLGEWSFARRFAVVTVALAAGGFPLGRMSSPLRIQLNEALVITALVFVTAALALSWPFMAAGLSYLDALFEAVSSITTTGLSTLPSVEHRSASFLFARAWGQWYGGLAVLVLALALVLEPGAATKRLGSMEGSEDILGSTRSRARTILAVYGVLTVAGVLLVVVTGVDWFEALLQSLAAVSTGGFSTRDASLAGLGPWPTQAAVILISLAGAISFSLYSRGWYTGWRAFVLDRELLWLLVAGLATTGFLMASMIFAGHYTLGDIVSNGPLMAFSAQTTAGFATVPVNTLDPASKAVLIVSMFVGGDMGSTAGGIKILRLLVVAYLMREIVVATCLPPHAVVEMRIAGRKMEHPEMRSAVTTVLWYGLTVLVSWIPFLLLRVDPLDGLFEVVSATGTVGLSSGVTSLGLHPLLKLVLCVDMLLGRLEVVALLVLVYPRTWFGRRVESL